MRVAARRVFSVQKRYPMQTRAKNFEYRKPAVRKSRTAGVVETKRFELSTSTMRM